MFQEGFEVVAGAGELLADGVGGLVGYSGYFVDGVALHVVEEYRGAFFFGQTVKCHIQFLILECLVGGVGAVDTAGFGYGAGYAGATTAADKGVVGYAVNPCREPPVVPEAVARQVCLDECVLGKIVGERAVTATQCSQKTAYRFLILLYVTDELLSVHLFSMAAGSIIVLDRFASHEIHYEICKSDCK